MEIEINEFENGGYNQSINNKAIMEYQTVVIKYLLRLIEKGGKL